MGAVELVGRTEQEIGIEGGDVDREMGRVVHRVEEQPGPHRARQLAGQRHVVDRAEGVGGEPHRHEPRARADLGGEAVGVERAIGPQRNLADDQAAFGEPQPGTAIGLVVELGDDDLVARRTLARHGVRQREGERRHVGAEGDRAPVRGAEESGRLFAHQVQQLVGAPRRGELTVRVGVRLAIVAGDGVDHRRRHLRPRRAVEEGDRQLALAAGEGGELKAGALAVAGGEGHRGPRVGRPQCCHNQGRAGVERRYRRPGRVRVRACAWSARRVLSPSRPIRRECRYAPLPETAHAPLASYRRAPRRDPVRAHVRRRYRWLPRHLLQRQRPSELDRWRRRRRQRCGDQLNWRLCRGPDHSAPARRPPFISRGSTTAAARSARAARRRATRSSPWPRVRSGTPG